MSPQVGGEGRGGVVVVSGNTENGITIDSRRVRVFNTMVGVDVSGSKPVPNMGESGILLSFGARDCSIGAPGTDRVTVVSGNAREGISVYGVRTRILNIRVGLGLDGTTPVPNLGEYGVTINDRAHDCTVGGDGGVTVVSGNTGMGLIMLGARGRVLNTLVGVGADGVTAVPNLGDAGLAVKGPNCTIGTSGSEGVTVVSGNLQYGLALLGEGGTVINTLVGLAIDGVTPVPNRGDCALCLQSSTHTVVRGSTVSGNLGNGVRVDGGSNVTLVGNTIGLSRNRSVAVGNFGMGIVVLDGPDSPGLTIGGAKGSADEVQFRRLWPPFIAACRTREHRFSVLSQFPVQQKRTTEHQSGASLLCTE